MTNEGLTQARAALDIIASGNTDPDRMVAIARQALAAFDQADAAKSPATSDEATPSAIPAAERGPKRFCVYGDKVTTHTVIVEAADEEAAYEKAGDWFSDNVGGNWELWDCEEVGD